jgi:hypothetical protein
MILPGGLVEFPIINAHTLTSDRPLRNEPVLLITDDSDFFGTTCTGLTHLLSETG